MIKNIFVSVGTTPFDELIKYVDKEVLDKEIICQISNFAKYKPKNHKYFGFTKNIDEYYNWADLVVCHAGAGTVYKLLEMRKKIIVVPNTYRIDKHQNDLSRFIEEKNYALVCHDIDKLKYFIEQSSEFTPNQFLEKKFFVTDEILELFL